MDKPTEEEERECWKAYFKNYDGGPPAQDREYAIAVWEAFRKKWMQEHGKQV